MPFVVERLSVVQILSMNSHCCVGLLPALKMEAPPVRSTPLNCVISVNSNNYTTEWMRYHCVTQGMSPSSAEQAAERTLAMVGRGVTLSLDRSSNTAWLYNRSQFPVFVLSPTTQVVFKLRPAQSACVYEWPTWGQWLHDNEDRKTDFEGTSRQPDCILVSFVKGWRGRYKRRSILSCPCWLQVLLAHSPDGSWNEETLSWDLDGKRQSLARQSLNYRPCNARPGVPSRTVKDTFDISTAYKGTQCFLQIWSEGFK